MQQQSRPYKKNSTPRSRPSTTTRLTPQFSRIVPTPSPASRRGTATPKRSSTLKKKRLTFQSASKKKALESPLQVEEEGDRFVPFRGPAASQRSYEFDGYKSATKANGTQGKYGKDERNRLLYESLLDEPVHPKALFSFSGRKRSQRPYEDDDDDEYLRGGPFEHDSIRLPLKSADKESNKRAKIIRRQLEIPPKPYKVLDAPDLRQDFYLHLLSWSKANVLAVALDHTVYLWQPSSVTNLMSVREHEFADSYVTCLSWCELEPKYLAIGCSGSKVHVYDAVTQVRVCSFKYKRESENMRRDLASVLTWNQTVLSVGSKSGRIQLWDAGRSGKAVGTPASHLSTVCSFDWNADKHRLASGGNDNMVHIQDIRKLQGPFCTLHGHNAAVKALSWCPFKPEILVTGGGTQDRCIKIWKSGVLQKSIETGCQVTSFEWNPCQRELVSAAGYYGGKLVFWKFPSLDVITEVKLQGERILFTTMSPDHNTIVTGGCDQMLAFWQVNPHGGGPASADSFSFSTRPIR